MFLHAITYNIPKLDAVATAINSCSALRAGEVAKFSTLSVRHSYGMTRSNRASTTTNGMRNATKSRKCFPFSPISSIILNTIGDQGSGTMGKT